MEVNGSLAKYVVKDIDILKYAENSMPLKVVLGKKKKTNNHQSFSFFFLI